MAQNYNDSEPILWAEKAVREKKYRKDGAVRTARFPQTAQGLARRWRYVVDSAGNTLRLELTNAAAEGDLDGPSARQRRVKWSALGWYELGKCPVALMHSGQISKYNLEPSVRTRPPCEYGTYSEKEPCECARIERSLRAERHTASWKAREPHLKDLGAQMQEATAKQAEANKELVHGMAGAFREVLEEMKGVSHGAEPQAPEPGDDPPKGPRARK